MEKIIESNKEQDTYDLGYELGQHAKPGQVFTLVGDLGVGKTVFTKGLAAGLGITEPVNSPTFTIRCMMKGACRSIILMFTGSVMWKRWTRSVMRIMSTAKGSA